MPKLKSPDLGVKGGIECSVPQLEADVKAPGANLHLGAPDIGLKGPSVDVSAPDLNVNLKGGLDVKSPIASVGAAEVGFEDLSGTIKLPSLKLPQFGISGPGINGADAGVSIEGPQVQGGLKGSGAGSEGAELELKGPQLHLQSPGVSSPDVDLKLKGPNIKEPGAGLHLEGPSLDVSAPKLNIKGPKIKGGAAVAGEASVASGGLHLAGPKVTVGVPQGSAEGSLGKVSFPKLRMPKFVFSEPEVKGREVGVDVEFPGADVSLQEPEAEDGKAKKSKIKMPKFNFSKAKGKSAGGAGSPELPAHGVDLKASKASLGSVEGDLDEGTTAKGKFSLFKSRKARHRSSSFSDDRSAHSSPTGTLEMEGAAKTKAPKMKFGTFGGMGSKTKGSYEVTGSDEEAAKPSRLSSSSSTDSTTKIGVRMPSVELTVAKRKE